MTWLGEMINITVGSVFAFAIIGLLVLMIVVWFWTWIITHEAMNIIEKRKKKDGTEELTCLREITILLSEQSRQLGEINLYLKDIKQQERT